MSFGFMYCSCWVFVVRVMSFGLCRSGYVVRVYHYVFRDTVGVCSISSPYCTPDCSTRDRMHCFMRRFRIFFGTVYVRFFFSFFKTMSPIRYQEGRSVECRLLFIDGIYLADKLEGEGKVGEKYRPILIKNYLYF